jgi:hypothetical protein
MEGDMLEPMRDQNPDQNEDRSELPGLPSRLVAVFFSPGRLVEQLARDPKWLGALLVTAIIAGVSMALVPADLFMEANRQAAMERGADFPEMSERALQLMQVVIPVTTVITTMIMSFVFAGLYTGVFAFVLGDEGGYKQYLAVVSHAWFIAILFGLLITPLRISTGNVQLTLNLGSFMGFLPDGYLANLFRLIDLTQIWSTLVIAYGVHAIDKRRSFGSAVTILLVITFGIAAIMARFI